MPKSPGVFCVEADWDRDLRVRSSVRPVLDLLHCTGVADYIHRDCGTRGEFEHYVTEWTRARYKDYAVLYIAAHGSADVLHAGFNVKNEIRLWELQDLLAGKCRNRVLYFGACSVFNIKDGYLTEFAETTKASAIVGYRKPVPWLESAAFEAMLLSELVRRGRVDGFVTNLTRRYGTQAKGFGLMAATARKTYPAR